MGGEPLVIRVPGKVILAGEHGAVRGGPALVLPLCSRFLELTWEENDSFGLAPGPFRESGELAFRKAASILGQPLPPRLFSVESQIPPRAGLGSSAALAAAVAQYLLPKAGFPELFPLALAIEDIFHGKSSGMDVAAVLSPGLIRFRRGEAPTEILSDWRPALTLHDTGLRSATKDCVEQVTKLAQPELDEKMADAVMSMEKAWSDRSLPSLAKSMEDATQCFAGWNLIPAPVSAQADKLRKAGALAVKPTGSGNGGYLLALWERAPAGSVLSVW
jgi:mevalonate kinase